MNLKILLAAGAGALALSGAAHASTVVFDSTFENVPGGPSAGGYTTVATADGWTGGPNGIELQNNVAGAPAANGGSVFVELDTFANSSMSRTIGAGSYDLSFLYSPRPGIPASSNGIEVFLNGVLLSPPGLVTADGGGATSWSTVSTSFVAAPGSILTFAAEGTSDSLGGYVDNITLSAVPEPTTWAMMLIGVGMVGFGLRTRKTSAAVAA